MRYFLSRQIQWPTGANIVEIAAGGLDRSGPGMLCPGFSKLGEGKEFIDPRKALKAAFAIRKSWHELLRAEACADPTISDEVRIEAGYNLDMIAACEEPTDAELHEWAEEEWEATPKCHECGDPIELEKSYYLHEFGEDSPRFCSEHCTEKHHGKWLRREDAERYG